MSSPHDPLLGRRALAADSAQPNSRSGDRSTEKSDSPLSAGGGQETAPQQSGYNTFDPVTRTRTQSSGSDRTAQVVRPAEVVGGNGNPKPQNPELNSSWISRLLLLWAEQLLTKAAAPTIRNTSSPPSDSSTPLSGNTNYGTSRAAQQNHSRSARRRQQAHLQQHHLWSLQREYTCRHNSKSLERGLEVESGVGNKLTTELSEPLGLVASGNVHDLSATALPFSLLSVIRWTCGKAYFSLGLLLALTSALEFVGPWALYRLVNLFSMHATEEKIHAPHESMPWWRHRQSHIVYYISLLVVSRIARALLFAHFFYRSQLAMTRVTVGLKGLIFRKALRLSEASRLKRNDKDIINHYTADVGNLVNAGFALHQTWVLFFQLVFTIIWLSWLVDKAVLAGLGMIFLLILLTNWVSAVQARCVRRMSKATQVRMESMRFLFDGITVTKFSSLENKLQKVLEKIRAEECSYLKSYLLLGAANIIILWSTPFLVTGATLGAFCCLLHRSISPAIVFATVSLFRIMQEPCRALPTYISALIFSKISIERIRSFLSLEEELDEGAARLDDALQREDLDYDVPREMCICLQQASYTRSSASTHSSNLLLTATTFALDKIDLSVSVGELVLCSGPSGSGKSALLSALAGRLRQTSGRAFVHGSIAYTSQRPWLQKLTIRENILFGRAYNIPQYNRVLDVCQLLDNLATMQEGDNTVIDTQKDFNTYAEGAVTLSVQARIALARACYSGADILVLDTPFIEMDIKTARAVFQRCIVEYLVRTLGKTVIIATQIREFTQHPAVDRYIQLKDKTISFQEEKSARAKKFATFKLPEETLEEREDEERQDREDAAPHRSYSSLTSISLHSPVSPSPSSSLAAVPMPPLPPPSVSSVASSHSSGSLPTSLYPTVPTLSFHASKLRKKKSLRVHHLAKYHKTLSQEADDSSRFLLGAGIAPSADSDSASSPSTAFSLQHSQGREIAEDNSSEKRTRELSIHDDVNFALYNEVKKPTAGAVPAVSLTDTLTEGFTDAERKMKSFHESLVHNIPLVQPPPAAKGSLSSSSTTSSAIVADETSVYQLDSLQSVTAADWGPVFYKYFQSAGSFLILIILFFIQLAWQCIVFFSDYWLALWSDHTDTLFSSSSSSSSSTSSKKSTRGDLYFFAIYLLLSFGCIALVSLRTLLVALSGWRASRVIYSRLLGKLLKAPLSLFTPRRNAKILSCIVEDLVNADIRFPFAVGTLLATFFSLFAMLLVVCVFTKYLVFVLVPATFYLYALIKVYLLGSREISRLAKINHDRVSGYVSSTLHRGGVPLLQTFGRIQMKIAIKQMEELTDRNNESLFAQMATAEWLAIRIQLTGACLLFVVLLLLFFVVSPASISGGVVGLVIAYCLAIDDSLETVSSSWAFMDSQSLSVYRIQHIISRTPSEAAHIISATTPSPHWPSKGDVVFKDVSFRYRSGDWLALKDLNCHILGGSKIGVVGPTGSGKMTMLLSLFRINELASGKIMIDGIDSSHLGLKTLRKALGLVTVHEPLLGQRTLRGHIDPFSEHSDEEIFAALEAVGLPILLEKGGRSREAEREQQIAFLLNSSFDDERISRYHQMLLSLAAIVLRKPIPRVIIVDLITGTSNSVEKDKNIFETAIRIAPESTVIALSTHRDAVVSPSTSRVLVMSQGQMREFDTVERLKSREGSFFLSLGETKLSSQASAKVTTTTI